MTDRMQFNLLDNALDYLMSAAEHAKHDERRHWKYALLHLVASLELLVKARLEHEHWSLLFADVDRANETSLRSGDFRSVDFDTACARLKNIATVHIDKVALQRLEELRKLRHRVQHFAIDVDLEQVKSLLAKGINFCVDFCRSNLASDIGSGEEAAIQEILQHLREFEEFAEERLNAISGDLEKAADVWDCPRCWERTLVIGQGQPHCPFCGFETTATELAQTSGEGPLEGECLACGEETLCFVLFTNEEGADCCTSCGTRQGLCQVCHRRFFGTGYICPECEAEGRWPDD
jgi:hypothetical protein